MKKLALTLVLVSAGLACATTDKPKALDRPVTSAKTPAPKVAELPKAAADVNVSAGPEAPASPIYFAFDSDELTPDSQTTLQQMAAYLKAHPQAKLTIEGHCDETGSEEYNLALGDRRARAARSYLKNLGVDEVRLNSISYGEERPAVAGNDDAAHQKNRRGQFDLKVAG